MKKNIASSVVITVFALLVLGSNCFGQARIGAVAEIPFDFQVGERTMKAGKYEFESANPQSNPWLMVVRRIGSTGDRSSAIVPTKRSTMVAADSEAAISFNRYGSTHYLSSITAPSIGVVLRLSKTAEEKQLAKVQFPEEARVLIHRAAGPSR